MTPLEKAARAVDPAAWAFYDKWIGTPAMLAECKHEVGPSFMKARAVLMAVREPGDGAVQAGWDAAVDNEGCTPECCWPAMLDAILNEAQP